MFTHFTLRCSVIFNNRSFLRAVTLCVWRGRGVFDNVYFSVRTQSLSFVSLAHWVLFCFISYICVQQVGDEIVEINGEPARGISHTRAIELIQAGGNKVVLLLRPGAGLAQDGSKC